MTRVLKLLFLALSLVLTSQNMIPYSYAIGPVNDTLTISKHSKFGKEDNSVRQQRTRKFIEMLEEISGDYDSPKSSKIEGYYPYPYERPLKYQINRKNLSEDANIKTGKAARIRTKKLGLSRGPARYNNPRVLENPNIYGPYLSAMLKDEDLQQLVDFREDELCEAFEKAMIERNILESNSWLGKIKKEKAKIIERRNAEFKVYGRFLKPGENPNATLREKVMDIEARRRLGLDMWEEEILDTFDWESEMTMDTLLRKKADVHPFFYKYLAPIYFDDELDEYSPEDFISMTDMNMTFRKADYDITDRISDELPNLDRYRNFTLDNLMQYGPTYGEIINSFYILGLIRFIIMSIKYNPTSGLIVAITGLASVYSYMALFKKMLLDGCDTYPGAPNLFRLGLEIHSYNEASDRFQKEAARNIRLFRKFPSAYLLEPESMVYYTVKRILFWFRHHVFVGSSIENFVHYYDDKLAPDFLTSSDIIGTSIRIYSFIVYIFRSVKFFVGDYAQSFIDGLYLSQILRGSRRFVPYPLYWHLGMNYMIKSLFFPKWESCIRKFDQYIQLKLVPEMRYEDIVTAEFVRTYWLIIAVYLVVLAMLHAIFNQFYYLPFVSEIVDVFFGKRSDFKQSQFLRNNPQLSGGDLSWQNQWEFMESRRGDFKIWYGLLGKPRKYKFPKWMRIFNPVWWLKRIRRRRKKENKNNQDK